MFHRNDSRRPYLSQWGESRSFWDGEDGNWRRYRSPDDSNRGSCFPDDGNRSWLSQSTQSREYGSFRDSEDGNRRHCRSPCDDNRRPPSHSSQRKEYRSFRDSNDGGRYFQSRYDGNRSFRNGGHSRSPDDDNRWQLYSSPRNATPSFRSWSSNDDNRRHSCSSETESNNQEKVNHKTRYRAHAINRKFSRMHPDDLTEEDKESWRWAKKINEDHTQAKMETGINVPQVTLSSADYTEVKLPKQIKAKKRKYKPGEAIPVYVITLGVVDRGVLDGSISGKNWQIAQEALQSVCHPDLRDDSSTRHQYDDSGWFRRRIKIVKFTDERTANLYEAAIKEIGEIWPGAKLEVVPYDEMRLIIRYVALVPVTTFDIQDISQLIKIGNPHFPTDWMITDITKKDFRGCTRIILFLGKESSAALSKCCKRLYYGFGTVIVNKLGNDRKIASEVKACKGEQNIIALCDNDNDDDADNNLDPNSVHDFRPRADDYISSDVGNREQTIALAVIDKNSGITIERWANLQSCFLALYKEMLQKSPGHPPQCDDTSWHGSYIKIIKCADGRSAVMYKEVFDRLSEEVWSGAKLELVHFENLPIRPRAFSWIPARTRKPQEILDVLKSSNPMLPMHDWWIETIGHKLINGRIITEFRINDMSLQILRHAEGKAKYGSEVIVISSNLDSFTL